MTHAFRSVYKDTAPTRVILIAWDVLYYSYMPQYFGSLPDQESWEARQAELYELVDQAVGMRVAGHDDQWAECELNVIEVHISASELISSNIYICQLSVTVYAI